MSDPKLDIHALDTRGPALISLAAVTAMLALSAWAYPHIPDAPVAVHWGLDGRANGYAGRGEAVLAMPAVALGISMLMALLPRIMPQAGRLQRSAMPYRVTWLGTLALMAVVHIVLIMKALGAEFDVIPPIAAGLGLLLAVIGNVLGKIRYNYAIGFRIPWTLANERVWDKTHRFTGRWMMAGGIALAILAALPGLFDDAFLGGTLLVCATAPAVMGMIYAIVISRKVEGAA